jgi:tetratricopeptide (TPR) repeat protein
MKYLTFLIFSLAVFFTSAQSKSELRIANNYANKGQCSEAIKLYENLKTKVSFQSIYHNYYTCLLSEERYSKAIELVKEAQKNTPIKYDTLPI